MCVEVWRRCCCVCSFSAWLPFSWLAANEASTQSAELSANISAVSLSAKAVYIEHTHLQSFNKTLAVGPAAARGLRRRPLSLCRRGHSRHR